MNKNKQNKAQYSSAEKRAYYIGVGVAMGLGKFAYVKRQMERMSPLEKESFKNGFDDHLIRRANKKKGR